VPTNGPNLDQIESVLRLVDREVWIITAAIGPERGGLTATWILPASIDRQRPMLLVGLGPNHYTTRLIERSGAFGAHLLRADQSDLAWTFSENSGRDRDKLAGLPLDAVATGSPILKECHAWFDCRVVGRYDAGDRYLYWADVVAAAQVGSGHPLREQQFFRSLTEEQRKHLLAAREADVKILRPLHEAWRNSQSALFDLSPSKQNQP
jgi:flavin reductase (DIM6/NTAB) family NADH-FMN oxidoreductase RutF